MGLAEPVATAAAVTGDAFEVQHAAAHPADHPLALAQAPGQTRGWRLRRVEALRFNGPAVGAGDQSIQAIIVAIGDSPEAPVAPGEPRQVAARHTLDRMLGQ